MNATPREAFLILNFVTPPPMKTLLLLCLAAACPLARGDTQAVPLTAGPSPNFIGAHVVHPPIPTPALPSFAGTGSSGTITYGGGPWTSALNLGLAYAVEHPATGFWARVTAINPGLGKLTISPAWSGPGVTPILRQAMTVDELFGGDNLPLINKGPMAGLNTDKIWVPNGTGWKIYWRNNVGLWRRAGTTGDRGHEPIYFIQGMAFYRKVSGTTLTFPGNALLKATSQSLAVMKNFDTPSALTRYSGTGVPSAANPHRMLVSSVFGGTSGVPLLKTLSTSGLSATVLSSDQSSTADGIQIPQTGGAVKDFYHYDDGVGFSQWADLDGNDASTQTMGTAFLYFRKAPLVTHTLVP